MKLSKLIKIALASVWSNKMRSFLTMLGIIIGISSVIILMGLGKGTQKSISDKIESLGTNLITVNISSYKYAPITDADLKSLTKQPGIKKIAPDISSSVYLKAGDNSYSTTVEATTPDYTEIKKTDVSSGRFITQMDIENKFKVAVIGTETAEELFNSTNVVGQNVYISGIKFEIVGLLKSSGTSSSGSNDDKIIIPLSTGERLLQNKTPRTYYVEATSSDKVDTAMSYLKLFLNNKYGESPTTSDSDYYKVMDQTSILETATSATSSMTSMLAGIAAISLVVGGIGIMNIMLVSVIERTREIGVRKAIGAKRRTILTQFLIEAASISGLGGLIGVGIGYLGAYIGKTFLNTTIVISNDVVLEAFVFSVLVGIVFGIYPANRASKLNPIDALRFE